MGAEELTERNEKRGGAQRRESVFLTILGVMSKKGGRYFKRE